jgi:hypothetical protein
MDPTEYLRGVIVTFDAKSTLFAVTVYNITGNLTSATYHGRSTRAWMLVLETTLRPVPFRNPDFIGLENGQVKNNAA